MYAPFGAGWSGPARGEEVVNKTRKEIEIIGVANEPLAGIHGT
jgi:hypothetical protein